MLSRYRLTVLPCAVEVSSLRIAFVAWASVWSASGVTRWTLKTTQPSGVWIGPTSRPVCALKTARSNAGSDVPGLRFLTAPPELASDELVEYCRLTAVNDFPEESAATAACAL